ncbi:hypothetical protein GGR88_000604 [Sphingomonas jejuensis]|uniref:Uncharacterized protein n=1 Tax=Sphingomonas jejuensis TaxID=904715 RepID=A0ABX0XIR6_9SPHN|nr:DUF5818 domain-containing protein [Sphingomonas jejuensis]NJC33130.1 hypothetical protein [Sphingomonas jejuensis]
MPRGSQHELTGRLDRDGHGFILRPDGGGQWRLDTGFLAGWKASGLVGRNVRVLGTRDAFNVLAVSRIEPSGW